MEITFDSLISGKLTQAILQQGIEKPTDIQAQAIPYIIEGRDVIASSPTGTGKTLAYLLPVFEKIDINIKSPQAIILAPTHELAAQIYREAEKISKTLNNGVEPALIIGGANIERQLARLKEKPRIIIGSAGRIIELNKMKKLSVHYVKIIVLDEGDRLLDTQNNAGTMDIINRTLRDRQLTLFSATVSAAAMTAAESIMKQPVKIILTQTKLPENLDHIYFICEQREKIEILRKLVHACNISRALVFINNENSLEILVKRLNYHGISAAGLYGSAHDDDRRLALEAFRTGRAKVLVASDLASRGLDITGITHAINFDCPENPEIYLHRAGRCGRMGEKGVSVTIATEKEVPDLLRNGRKLGIEIVQKQIKYGKIM